MSYLQFPLWAEADAPNEGAEFIPVFSTISQTSRSGLEQRRPAWTLPRHRFKLRWDKTNNGLSYANSLYAFFCQCQGSYLPWAYIHHDAARVWSSVYVAQTVASPLTYDLPGYYMTSASVYVDGVADAGATIAHGSSGNNYRDIVTLSGTPAVGKQLTVSFTGRRWFLLRFAADEMTFTEFSVGLFGLGVEAIEVKGE
jgi:hypothetical protein